MHRFANPARFLSIAKPLTPVLFWPGLLLALGACWWGLTQVPAERLQGDTVKILFVHVPAAWLGMAGWSGIAIASIVQLVWRHPLAGVSARAIAVPGAAFAAICLITGSIWGRPAWGTWWVWDGRLTSMLVLFFLYLGYIALTNASSEKGSVSRIAAVFGIIGAVNIPDHQPFGRMVGKPAPKGEHYAVWLVNRCELICGRCWSQPSVFRLLFGAIVLMRMRTALAEIRIEARMRRMAEE